MKLKNHIAHLFLTDDNMANHIAVQLSSQSKEQSFVKKGLLLESTYALVSPQDQKAYYITDTVVRNIDYLKVYRSKETGLLDWTVFDGKIKEGKYTYIFGDGSLIRMRRYATRLGFCFIAKDKSNYVEYHTFYLDTNTSLLSDNYLTTGRILEKEEMIFKLLCFLFLTESQEQVLKPSGKTGTMKSGKIINSLPFPLTVVTSKWNVTTIRTEGFPVSGHFRLQPVNNGHKLIYIEPFEKHGYIRKSASECLK